MFIVFKLGTSYVTKKKHVTDYLGRQGRLIGHTASPALDYRTELHSGTCTRRDLGSPSQHTQITRLTIIFTIVLTPSHLASPNPVPVVVAAALLMLPFGMVNGIQTKSSLHYSEGFHSMKPSLFNGEVADYMYILRWVSYLPTVYIESHLHLSHIFPQCI